MSVDDAATSTASFGNLTDVTSLAFGSTSADRVCFLVAQHINDLNIVLGEALCSVAFDEVEGWSVTATVDLGPSTAGQLSCTARCVSWEPILN